MMVEVHAGLLHVLDEVGGRHYAHQSAGLQVQFLLSDGEEFLCVCRERQNEISFLFQAALAPRPPQGRCSSAWTFLGSAFVGMCSRTQLLQLWALLGIQESVTKWGGTFERNWPQSKVSQGVMTTS